MSKFMKLSRAEMKHVLGGGLPGGPGNPNPSCQFIVVCGHSSPDYDTFWGICCNTAGDAQTYCRAHGYQGIYGCIVNPYANPPA
ncbi:MAG: hypothetical protein WC615_08705 [Mucilaginibacter sp.]|jgi:hypothetical protein|uniref:hypothetical protein n=1 Tax=Mucilaginibacter sp. TaxID=1882438 RepID=UPI003561E83C